MKNVTAEGLPLCEPLNSPCKEEDSEARDGVSFTPFRKRSTQAGNGGTRGGGGKGEKKNGYVSKRKVQRLGDLVANKKDHPVLRNRQALMQMRLSETIW